MSTNYEKFIMETYGSDVEHDMSIETIANTSLGIQGWALSDFGINEEPHLERTTYTFYTHDPSAEDHPQGDADEINSDEWDSEAEISELESLPVSTDEDEEPWTEVGIGRRGGRVECSPKTELARLPNTSKAKMHWVCGRRAPYLLCSSEKCTNFR